MIGRRMPPQAETESKLEAELESGIKPEPTVSAAQARPRRHRGLLYMIVAVAGLLLTTGAVTAYTLVRRLNSNVGRIGGVFEGLDESKRPKVVQDNGLTFLLLGSDTRSKAPTSGVKAKNPSWPAAGLTDVIMLFHVSEDRRSASVVSILRDSWVDIPDIGKAKINAAYPTGGPPRLISTIEQITNIRIDHFAIVDFQGFKAIVDAVGGVDVRVAKTVTSSDGVTFRQGINHLNGAKALSYVRQRHGLEHDDFDRVKRQQNLIRAIMTKLGSVDPVENPVQTYRLLNAITKSISVDDTINQQGLQSLALSMAGLRNSGVSFVTAPIRGSGWEMGGQQQVLYLNEPQCAELWDAVRGNTVPEYVATHAGDSLPAAPE